MKKSVKITLIIAAICAALFVCAFFVVSAAFSDKITGSVQSCVDKTILFKHTTDKGEELEIPFSCNSSRIGDNTYLLDIFMNDDQISSNYDISNAKVSLNLKNSTEVILGYYSEGGSSYTNPQIDYSDNSKVVRCLSDSGYIHLRLLLSDADEMLTSDSGENGLSFTVEYDIKGKGLYFGNSFHHTWEAVSPRCS